MARDTSIHVRQARAGDRQSLDWLIEHFSPWLLAQARQRLAGKQLGASPEDLVHDVWLRTLPALPGLQAREGRETPVLMKFLATTLLYRHNELARARARRAGATPAATSPPPDALAAETRGLLTRLEQADGARRILTAIESLPEPDRQVVLLRAVEQHSNQKVAELLGQTPNAVSLRFNRALATLRDRLGPSLLDEMVEGE